MIDQAPAGLEPHQVERREASLYQRQLGLKSPEESVPVSAPEHERQVLDVDRAAVHGFAATVHGHLHRRAEMVQGIFAPVEVDGQVTRDATLLDESYCARRVTPRADLRRDANAGGEAEQGRDAENESRAE